MKRFMIAMSVAALLISCVSVGTVTPLHEAVRDGDLNAALKEVDSGARLNAQDSEGRTPLHYACANGEETIAKTLLMAGSDPNIQDSNGNTPLHYAATNCYASIAKMLIDSAADPSYVNEDEKKPVDIAKEIGCTDVTAILSSSTTH